MKRFACLAASAALALLAAPGAQALGQLEKCVDDKGRVYYGDSIPPDVLEKCRTSSQLSKQGVVKKDTRYLTGEERAAAEEVAAKKAEADKKDMEQRRRDNALLSSYSKEEEIDLAREKNLHAVQARIDGFQSNIKTLEERQIIQNKRVENLQKKNRPVPDELNVQASETRTEIKHLNEGIARANKEKSNLSARFAEDKKRFRVLKGFDPAPEANANGNGRQSP